MVERLRLLTGAFLLAALAGATAAQEPVVPRFWDPRHHAERPPAGTVPAIRFVTTDDFPPFHFLDAAGRLTGFDIDLARALCDELAVPCTMQARPWEDLVPALAEKRADAAIAGIAITAESRRRLAFSDVYLRSPARFIVRQDAPTAAASPEVLRGRTVAVVAGSAHEAYLAAFFAAVERKPVASVEAAAAAVKAGEAYAAFGDAVQLSFWLGSDAAAGCCAFAGGPYLETRFFGLGYAVAVAPEAGDLRAALNSALEAVYEKGVYADLYLRYFPIGLY